jgi:hypothetical protein
MTTEYKRKHVSSAHLAEFVAHQIFKNAVANLLISLVGFGLFADIAHADTRNIMLSIDGTQTPSFSELLERAESLAEREITRQFQTDVTLSELQVTVVGDRNGQTVSLLTSKLSREAWQSGSGIHPWTEYFATSSVLLGYRSPTPISTRVATRQSASNSRLATPELSPSQTVQQAFESGRLSDSEYWRLVDALD